MSVTTTPSSSIATFSAPADVSCRSFSTTSTPTVGKCVGSTNTSVEAEETLFESVGHVMKSINTWIARNSGGVGGCSSAGSGGSAARVRVNVRPSSDKSPVTKKKRSKAVPISVTDSPSRSHESDPLLPSSTVAEELTRAPVAASADDEVNTTTTTTTVASTNSKGKASSAATMAGFDCVSHKVAKRSRANKSIADSQPQQQQQSDANLAAVGTIAHGHAGNTADVIAADPVAPPLAAAGTKKAKKRASAASSSSDGRVVVGKKRSVQEPAAQCSTECCVLPDIARETSLVAKETAVDQKIVAEETRESTQAVAERETLAAKRNHHTTTTEISAVDVENHSPVNGSPVNNTDVLPVESKRKRKRGSAANGAAKLSDVRLSDAKLSDAKLSAIDEPRCELPSPKRNKLEERCESKSVVERPVTVSVSGAPAAADRAIKLLPCNLAAVAQFELCDQRPPKKRPGLVQVRLGIRVLEPRALLPGESCLLGGNICCDPACLANVQVSVYGDNSLERGLHVSGCGALEDRAAGGLALYVVNVSSQFRQLSAGDLIGHVCFRSLDGVLRLIVR